MQFAISSSGIGWLALASAVLLWLCYFPVNWGWLAWIALVPLLCLVRTTAPAPRVYLWAWAGGLAFFWTAVQWIRVADYRMYATWAGLATYCSLYIPLGLYFVRRFERRTCLPLIGTFPIVWTGLEYVRGGLGGGFPWYFLGHTQHDFLPLIQIADLGGAYTVTFLVAAVNAFVFELLCWRPGFRSFFALSEAASRVSRSSLIRQFAAVLLVLGGSVAYGSWRLSQNDVAPGPEIALIQGNLEQRVRNAASAPQADEEVATQVAKHYTQLSAEAALRHPDLIVWPETCFPYGWPDVAPGLPPERIPPDWHGANARREELARNIAKLSRTNVLLGLNAWSLGADARERRYNSAVLVTPDGREGGRYDKIHCVPFGEYVPLRDWLPWMDAFAPYDFDYSITPGDKLTRFPLGKYSFGVVICYEDTDTALPRQYVDPNGREPAVDFLLNISNDGWWNDTSEQEQHLAICRFRAIECRRAVGRAVNTGISAVIDGNGRIIALPASTWAQSKDREAVVTARVPIDRRASLYARWGDWLPWTCWLTIGMGMVWSIVWPERFSNTMLG